MFYVEVDQDDLSKVLSKLKNLEAAPSHLRNAINRTLTATSKMMAKGRKGYVIKAGTFNQSVHKYRASPIKLEAEYKVRDKPHKISDESRYKTTNSKNKGVSATVLRGVKKQIVSPDGKLKGFIAGLPWNSKRGTSGVKKAVVIRKGKERLPLHKVIGLSSAKMAEQIYKGKVGDQQNMQDEIQKHLHDELMKEIDKIMEARKK